MLLINSENIWKIQKINFVFLYRYLFNTYTFISLHLIWKIPTWPTPKIERENSCAPLFYGVTSYTWPCDSGILYNVFTKGQNSTALFIGRVLQV